MQLHDGAVHSQLDEDAILARVDAELARECDANAKVVQEYNDWLQLPTLGEYVNARGERVRVLGSCGKAWRERHAVALAKSRCKKK